MAPGDKWRKAFPPLFEEVPEDWRLEDVYERGLTLGAVPWQAYVPHGLPDGIPARLTRIGFWVGHNLHMEDAGWCIGLDNDVNRIRWRTKDEEMRRLVDDQLGRMRREGERPTYGQVLAALIWAATLLTGRMLAKQDRRAPRIS